MCFLPTGWVTRTTPAGTPYYWVQGNEEETKTRKRPSCEACDGSGVHVPVPAPQGAQDEKDYRDDDVKEGVRPGEDRAWLRAVVEDAKEFYEGGYDPKRAALAEAEASKLRKTIQGGKGFREGIERTTSKGETILIKRPNHDLTHGVRKAMLTMDLIDTIVRTQAQSQTHDALQIWLNQRLNSDPLFRKKLQLAAIWQRAGRHSEASGGDAPNEYGRYCDDSAQYFATAAKKHLPEITDKELQP